MAAGYSGTPLPQKLGIKPEGRVALVDAPTDFALDLPAGARFVDGKAKDVDVVVWFVTARARFAGRLASVAARLQPAGGLWIAWPKKASGVATDMTENAVREVALPTGLVDNKVCAIDDTWSGLRLVVRVENRPKPGVRPKAGARPKARRG
ncbi:MAG TPA: DUF3052 family protein [Polyangia bacterium]|nr:DUF3052 family protein [Polyangia bacterium]